MLSPAAEAKRLAVLRCYGVLETAPEAAFSRFVQLAAALLEASGAALSFVGEQRVFYKAHYQVQGGASGRSYPRAQTPCYAAAFGRDSLVIEDAAASDDVAKLAFVRQNGVRFYVGVPLVAPCGEVLGALSVFDRRPRTGVQVTELQLELLKTLAQTVLDSLTARRTALARAQLQTTGARLTELLERSPYYAFSAAPDGQLDYLNAPLMKARSYRSPHGYYRDLYPPEAQDAAAAAFAKALETGQAQLTTTFLLEAGTRVPVVQELVRCEGAVAGIARDTAAQAQRDTFEQKRAEVLELTARGAPLPAVLLELTRLLETYCEGRIGAVFLVQNATLQLEVAPQLPSAFARLIRDLPLREVAAAPGAAALSGTRVVTTDIRHDPLWHHQRYFALQNGLQACWAEPILSDQDEVLGTFALYARETGGPTDAEGRLLRETAQLAAIAVSRQRLYAQLEHQARYDALTGLPNRSLLHEHLARAVRQAQAQEGGVSVFLFGLDNFKHVNDALGHSAGDALLTGVAERLQAHMQAQLPARTTLARSGGDEFVLIVPLEYPGDYQGDAARFAFELQAAFAAPFAVGERTVGVEASIGVSRYPEDAETYEALLRTADTAMYAAKADRRAGVTQGYRLYRSEMMAQLEAQLKLEAELKRAFAEDEFRIFIQPRFEIARQRITSFEVLVRWQHPEQGLLLPDAFLPGAQSAGLLPQLDAWVLREVVRHLGEGAARGRPERLSCNVSAASFQDRFFLSELEAVLGGNRQVSEGLELEITESLLMQNLDGVAVQLADLKMRFPGIRVAIDDFGSGYSSLSYLRHLPIDTLKIDRAFVRDLDHRDGKLQRTALAVIRTVIALGRDLGFRVVAEGAETEGQLGMLTALGVDEVQGFAISEPQPVSRWTQAAPGAPLDSSTFS